MSVTSNHRRAALHDVNITLTPSLKNQHHYPRLQNVYDIDLTFAHLIQAGVCPIKAIISSAMNPSSITVLMTIAHERGGVLACDQIRYLWISSIWSLCNA
ncbi:hypothetical protein TNCV_1173981 [Trichonephila clavipes]|nr:hypothetical protein TNCV_1173981 [Trichonephila clavipes]